MSTSTREHQGAGLEVDFHLALGKMADAFGGHIDRLVNSLQEHYATLANSGATSTTVVTTIALRPQIPVGRVYDVRMLTIAPNPLAVSNVITPVTCDVAFFAGSPQGGAIGSQYRDSMLGGSIPASATYSKGQFLIRGGDHLYIVLGKTAAAQDVQVTAVCGDNLDR